MITTIAVGWVALGASSALAYEPSGQSSSSPSYEAFQKSFLWLNVTSIYIPSNLGSSAPILNAGAAKFLEGPFSEMQDPRPIIAFHWSSAVDAYLVNGRLGEAGTGTRLYCLDHAGRLLASELVSGENGGNGIDWKGSAIIADLSGDGRLAVLMRDENTCTLEHQQNPDCWFPNFSAKQWKNRKWSDAPIPSDSEDRMKIVQRNARPASGLSMVPLSALLLDIIETARYEAPAGLSADR